MLFDQRVVMGEKKDLRRGVEASYIRDIPKPIQCRNRVEHVVVK